MLPERGLRLREAQNGAGLVRSVHGGMLLLVSRRGHSDDEGIDLGISGFKEYQIKKKDINAYTQILEINFDKRKLRKKYSSNIRRYSKSAF